MSSPQRHRERRGRTTLAVCLGLFALALLVRLYRLDAQSLWLDEGSSWELSQAGWGFLLGELFNPSAAYPLYHLLLKGWMALFGDSEAALRWPSALAGALAVPVIYLAAAELERLRERERGRAGEREQLPASAASDAPPLSWYGLAAAAITLLAPYAIWYSQEAKVYSLLLLTASLGLWALARALRTGARADWALALAIGLGGLFVHRLMALLLVAGVWAAAVLLLSGWRRRWGLAVAAALAGLLLAAMVGGLGGEAAAGRATAGAGIPAGPPLALGLTFARFSVDRWPGDGPWWWLVPWAALAAWGAGRALWEVGRPPSAERRAPSTEHRGPTDDRPLALEEGRLPAAERRAPTDDRPLALEEGRFSLAAACLKEERRRATFLLIMLGVPVGLFLAQLLFTRLYEARYLMVAYPAWALLLGYPLARPHPAPLKQGVASSGGAGIGRAQARLPWAYGALLVAALGTSGLALVQPAFGIFSGDPVKEQYREALAELAARVHPDDAVVLHPPYLSPLYRYYMGRLTADPAPEALLFSDFWQGETDYGQREWDIERQARLAGFTRSFLLIAPDHARTVDRPLPGDEYGLVGNFWAFSSEQRTWPCGIWRFNGAHLLCQEAPEPYYTGAPAPEPATLVGASFGDNLRLLGYTLKATTEAGPGRFRAGGSLPISLFWEVTTPPTSDYSLFLHLCQRCDVPPVAGEDGPPLEGYLPTRVWLPGKPARDDRAIALPADMPPGRYTLLLGLYDPNIPTEAGRLRVTGGERLGDDRLILGTVEIVAADAYVAASREQR